MRPSAMQRRAMDRDALALFKKDIRHIENAGAPDDGITGAGKCGKGSICYDTNTGTLWVNQGTKASPDWYFLGEQVST